MIISSWYHENNYEMYISFIKVFMGIKPEMHLEVRFLSEKIYFFMQWQCALKMDLNPVYWIVRQIQFQHTLTFRSDVDVVKLLHSWI